jgi:CheY-like chemotaxis protein
MTVMIVDDIITMCKSIHRMMKTIGYGNKFFYAHNGKEALRILQKESIDLVLMDYNMPEMTGGETLSTIRRDRLLRDIPVIMITAQAFKDYVAEAAESYVDALILKPLTIKILETKVAHVVEKVNNPPPIVAHLKSAMDFEAEGDIDAAIHEAKQAMAADPSSSRAIRELGYYYLKVNAFQEAEEWLLKAAEMNYLDVIAFHYLGELYLKMDDIEAAHHYFEKAMQISPRHLERGINFGKTLVQRQMIPRAILVFNEAFKLSGNSIKLREEIADFCINNGANEYAADLFEAIVRELPDRTDLFFILGKTLEKIGDVEKALTYLTRAEKVDPENLDIKIHLAKDYLSLDKPIWAEKALKRLLKIDPEHKKAKELIKLC